MTAPLGLLGELAISRRVLGVRHFSTSPAVSRKPSPSRVSANTVRPPAYRAMSANETQYGVGITTSSPLSTTADAVLKIACLPPTFTRHSATSNLDPKIRA